jgi:hypothetical protein
MKTIAFYFLFFFVLSNSFSQISFYSNDLSEKEIRELVDDRDDWKDKASEYERKLEAFRSIPRTPDNTAELQEKSRDIYRLRSELQGVKLFSETQRKRLKAEADRLEDLLSREKNNRANIQKQLSKTQDQILELNKTIDDQQVLIVNLRQEIERYKEIISDREAEIQARMAELIRTKILISEKGTDILIRPRKRKSIYLNMSDNDNTIPLKYIRRNKGFWLSTMYYRMASEMTEKRYPKAKFYLYSEYAALPIIKNERITLDISELPAKIEKNPGTAEFKEYIEQGVFYRNMPTFIKLPSNKKLRKGSYYFLMIIDEKMSVLNFFEII